MRKPNSLCVRCGELKRGPETPCPHCGLAPTSDLDRAKAWVLSTHPNHGYNLRRLREIGTRLRRGEPYVFEDERVQAAMEDLRFLAQTSPTDVLLTF